MVRTLAHVCLHCPDLDAAERFWCQGLGLTKRFRFIRNGALHGFYLDAGGGSFIEIFKGEPGPTDGAIRHLCLEVDAIESCRASLASAGFTLGERKLGSDRSWQAWVTAPGGVRMELHEYTDESSQRTGKDCIVTW